MRIVADTNVLISALITPFGNAARILDMLFGGELHLLYDDRILSEYRDVLLRPKFIFEEKDVDALLTLIEAEGIKVIATPVDYPYVDKDDIPFVEVAVTGNAEALITGNKRHFKEKSLNIMSPDEFLKFWGQRKR
ncbi:MAG: putative toxin-antitoxin system toxin component, PIN family [Thermodesulfovibrionales bacterium]|nr:putative toxin-antitoxin system toxin component, PIN family [Thermodesulfovibrionales bacterium]